MAKIQPQYLLQGTYDVMEMIWDAESFDFDTIASVGSTGGLALGRQQLTPDTYRTLLPKVIEQVPQAARLLRSNSGLSQMFEEASALRENASGTKLNAFEETYGEYVDELFPPELQQVFHVVYLREWVDHYGGLVNVDYAVKNPLEEHSFLNISAAGTVQIDLRSLILSNILNKGAYRLTPDAWRSDPQGILDRKLYPNNPKLQHHTYRKYLQAAFRHTQTPEGEGPVMQQVLVTRDDVYNYLDAKQASIEIVGGREQTWNTRIGQHRTFPEYSDDDVQEVAYTVHGIDQSLPEQPLHLPFDNVKALSDGLFVLGDLQFYVPPQRITARRSNQVYNLESLRTAGNPKLQSEFMNFDVTAALMFTGERAINEQLRPLIAMYKRAPLTTMRNTTIYHAIQGPARKYGDLDLSAPFDPMPAVLRSISLSTLPGFPHTLIANVSLSLFNQFPFADRLGFWRTTKDALDHARYVSARQTPAYRTEQHTADGKIRMTTPGGIMVTAAPVPTDPSRVTENAGESHAYIRYYRSILSEYQALDEHQHQHGYELPDTSQLLSRYEPVPDGDSLKLQWHTYTQFEDKHTRLQKMLYGISGQIQNLKELQSIATSIYEGDFTKSKELVRWENIGLFAQLRDSMASVNRFLDRLVDTASAVGTEFVDQESLIDPDKLQNVNVDIIKDILISDPDQPNITVKTDDYYQKILDQIKRTAATLKANAEAAKENGTNAHLQSNIQQERDKLVALTNLLSLVQSTVQSGFQRELNKDDKHLRPVTLHLGWTDDPQNFDNLPEPTSDRSEDPNRNVLRFPSVITGLSFSYRNKLTALPVQGHPFPTYQHLGVGEFRTQMTLQTDDEHLIAAIADLQSSLTKQSYEAASGSRSLHFKPTVKVLPSSNSYFAMLGIEDLAIENVNITSIDGSPGWFEISLDALQSDLSRDDVGRLLVNRAFNKTVLKNLSYDIFPEAGVKDRLAVPMQALADQILSPEMAGKMRQNNSQYLEVTSETAEADYYKRHFGEAPDVQKVPDGKLVDIKTQYLREFGFTQFDAWAEEAAPGTDIRFHLRCYDTAGSLLAKPAQWITRAMEPVFARWQALLKTAYDISGENPTGIYMTLLGQIEIWLNIMMDRIRMVSATMQAERPNLPTEYLAAIFTLWQHPFLNQKRQRLILNLAGHAQSEELLTTIQSTGLPSLTGTGTEIPPSVAAFLREWKRVQETPAGVATNYPDLQLPTATFDHDQYHFIGPDFPYISTIHDDALEENYDLLQNWRSFINLGQVLLAGGLTHMQYEDMKSDIVERYKTWLQTPDSASVSTVKELITEDAGEDYQFGLPGPDELFSSLEEFRDEIDKINNSQLFSQFQDPEGSPVSMSDDGTIQPDTTSENSGASSLDLSEVMEISPRLGRSFLFKLVKVKAILEFLSLYRVLEVPANIDLVRVEFPTPDEENFDPRDMEIRYKFTDAAGFYNSNLDEYLSKYILGNPNLSGEVTVTSSKQTTDAYMNALFAAKEKMVKLCNARDPEALADMFTGLGDTDAMAITNTLQEKLHDAQRNRNVGSLRRAFPTFKLYFVEEDANQWMLMDDFYSYDAIQNIQVVDNVNAASQTAVIALSNLSNRLTSENRAQFVGDTDQPSYLDKMMLRVGARILLKLGYGPDHRDLKAVFQGRVTEVNNGPTVEIIAQSWGAELLNPVGEEEGSGMYFSATSPEKTIGSAAISVLDQTPGLKHFGRWNLQSLVPEKNPTVPESLAKTAWLVKQTPNILNLLQTLPGTDYLTSSLKLGADLDKLIKSIPSLSQLPTSWIANFGNPLYENIYLNGTATAEPGWVRFITKLPNILGRQFRWRIYNQSTWDALWEMALHLGDYIVRPMPYNEHADLKVFQPRMTLYMGPRNGYYKYADSQFYKPSGRSMVTTDGLDELLSDSLYREFGDGLESKHQVIASEMQQKMGDLVDELIRRSGYKDGYFERLNMNFGIGIADFVKFRPSISQDDAHNLARDLSDLGFRNLAAQFSHFVETYFRNLAFRNIWLILLPSDMVAPIRIDVIKAFLSHNLKYLHPSYRTVFSGETPPTETALPDWMQRLQDRARVNWESVYAVTPEVGGWLVANPGARQVMYDWLHNDMYQEYLMEDLTNVVSSAKARNYNIDEMVRGNKVMETVLETAVKKGLVNGRAYRQVVQHHFVDSYHHIIHNDIEANADEMFNQVELVYPTKAGTIDYGQKNRDVRTYKSGLNEYIDQNYLRTYRSYQKNCSADWWLDYYQDPEMDRVFNQEAQPKDRLNLLRSHLPNYMNIGNQVLMNVAKPMYRGSLTLLGDPTIRPWDILHLYDDVNGMTGPVEVEQVVHSFSPTQGFTTTITPSAVLYHRDLSSSLDLTYMQWMGTMHLVTSLAYGSVEMVKYAGASLIIGQLLATNLGAAAVGLLSGPVGVTIGAGMLAYYLYQGMKAGTTPARLYAETKMARLGHAAGFQPLVLIPLNYRGHAFTAGMEGAWFGDSQTTVVWSKIRTLIEGTSQIHLLPGLISGAGAELKKAINPRLHP